MIDVKYITKFENGTTNAKLMQRFKNVEFLTGEPIRVLKVGYNDKKLSFVTFKTTRGIGEFYKHNDCLAMAKEESNLIIYFKGLKQ